MRGIACCIAVLMLAACGQKGPLVRPGEGPANTQYIIKGSDKPATATPAPTSDDSEHHD